MSDRQTELVTMLRTLRLARMATTASDIALKAAKESLSHEAFLYELARQECEYRTQRSIERRLHQAHLPREKTFRTFHLERFNPTLRLQIERLKTGAFVTETTNVIAIGPPSVGKSHAMAALGYSLIEQGHTVLWTTTAPLVQRLLAAKRDLRLPRRSPS